MGIDRESFEHKAQPVVGEVRIKDKKRLARNGKSQFDARKHDEPAIFEQELANVVSLNCGSRANEWCEKEVVMIGDRDCAETSFATRAYQFSCERSSIIVCDRPLTRPLCIARGVHLKVAPKEMRPVVVVHSSTELS